MHPSEHTAPNRNKRIILIAVVTISIACIAAFFTLVHLSNDALPGQSLYRFKTNVVEKVARTTKLTTHSRARYDTTLFEQRLHELTIIAADSATTSPEVVAGIMTLARSHADDVITILAKNQSLSGESRITILSNLNGLARAIETVSDGSAELTSIKDAANDTENTLDDALTSAIITFTTNNATSTIQSFIASNIAEVSAHIGDVAFGSQAQTLAVRRINDTNDAIIDNKFADALTAIIRAKQAIATDSYLYASERGPVDGISVEPGPIPEGN